MATVIVLVGCYYGYNAERRARSAWERRRRSRWCSTSCSCISSACSARRSSGARTHAPRSEAEPWLTIPEHGERTSGPTSLDESRRQRPPTRCRRRTSSKGAGRRASRRGARGAPAECRRERPATAAAVGRRRARARPRGRRRVPVAHRDQPPDRRPGRRRVHRRAQGLRPQQDPARPEHGPPRGQDLDDPRPVGHRQVGLHQAHGRPALPRRGRRRSCTASRCRTCPTTSCSRCARSSASCSRTARCSAR